MYLAQFGNFPFCRINIKENWQIGLKTQLEDTPYTDGKIRTNQINKNFKGDGEITLELWVSKEDDFDSFSKLAYNQNEKALEKVFFIRNKDKRPYIGTVEPYYEVFYNWAEVISPYQYNYTSELDNGGVDYDIYSITIRIINPYFYRIKNRLRFLKKADYSQVRNYAWGNYPVLWGGGGLWGNGINTISVDFLAQTPSQQKQLITNNQDDCCIQGLFLHTDIYFKFEGFGVESVLPSNQAKDRYSEIILTGTQGQNIDYVQDSNLPKPNNDISSGSGINLLTTANNNINIIEITNYNGTPATINNSALQNGERIEIYNPQTKSGFSLTWFSSITPCPPKLTIYTYIQDGIADGFGNWLDNYSGQYAGAYRLELLPESKVNDYLLTFRGLYPVNSNLELETSDQIIVRRNFGSTTTRTTRILISNLETFH